MNRARSENKVKMVQIQLLSAFEVSFKREKKIFGRIVPVFGGKKVETIFIDLYFFSFGLI